ncbi:cysteine-rich domain protein [delta proteobacterium NaphS2]|nr:cysteine-rich domain protein [delta proteobacterium NaphS2]
MAFHRMNKILEIDRESMCAVIQLGVINADLQKEVALHGLMYPPDPAILAAGMVPTTLELMDRTVLDVISDYGGAQFNAQAQALLLIEVNGDKDLVEKQGKRIEALCREKGAIAVDRAHTPVRHLSRPLRSRPKRGENDAPSKILDAISGLELIELENNRAGSICCGGGGNLEMTDPALSGTLSKRRIEEIRKTGAEKVVTACQQCVRTLKGQTRREKMAIEVMDITTVVARALRNV